MPTRPRIPESPPSPATAAPTLREAALEESFARHGYVVLDALDQHEVAIARRCWEDLHPEAGQGFVFDVAHRSPEGTEHLEASVGPILDGLLQRTLTGHQRFLLSYLTKWPGTDSALYMHQDWTYVDERRHRTLSYWIALDDCSEELGNGPVAVIPGSHHLVEAHRGPSVEDWYHDLTAELEALLVPVPLRAGQAILIDNALLHGSAPNRTDAPRRGLAAAVAPSGATFWFAAPTDDDQVTIYELGPRYFQGFDPHDPDVAERSVVTTSPRLVQVDAEALAHTIDRDLPADLAAAATTGPTTSAGGLDPAAGAVREELDHALAAGWEFVPASFLPRWAVGAEPTDRLLPLVHDGHATMAGRGPFRRTARAIASADPTASAWLVALRSGQTWTQLAPQPTVTLAAALAGGGAAAGSIAADGRPLTGGWSRAGSSLQLTNAGSAPAWVLVVSSGPGPADGRFRRARHRREADEAIAAVRPRSSTLGAHP